MSNEECRAAIPLAFLILHSSFDIRHSSFNLQSRCRMSDVTMSGQTPVPAVDEHHPRMCRPRMKNDECRMKNEERPSRSLSSFFILHSTFDIRHSISNRGAACLTSP